MKNWKTFVGGILLALGQTVPGEAFPAGFQWMPKALTAVGGIVIGAAAKDFDVHSTVDEVGKATQQEDKKP